MDNQHNETNGTPAGWHKPAKKETLVEVLNKIAALHEELRKYEKLASEMKETERQEAIVQARNLMRAHGLSLQDLGTSGLPRKSATAGKPAPVKYRDKATGNTWTGRGLQPNWLKAALNSGKKLEDFVV